MPPVHKYILHNKSLYNLYTDTSSLLPNYAGMLTSQTVIQIHDYMCTVCADHESQSLVDAHPLLPYRININNIHWER